MLNSIVEWAHTHPVWVFYGSFAIGVGTFAVNALIKEIKFYLAYYKEHGHWPNQQ